MNARLFGRTQPRAMRRGAALVGLTALAALLAVLVSAPVAQSQSPGYQQVSAGGYHTCALRPDGTAVCWGDNSYGQAPATRAGPFTQVSAGGYHTCGLKNTGVVECWGRNTISVNTGETSYEEVYVGQADPPPGILFTQVSTGDYHTCGLKPDGSVECWGRADDRTGPFTQVSAGNDHNCAIRKSDGTVACWGANGYGQANPPAGVVFTQVSAGENHTCALDLDGNVVCWGGNTWGQAPATRTGPYTQIAAGDLFTCGLKTDGALDCWGYNFYGQRNPPAGVFTAFELGGAHGCAISEDDKIYCWGRNDHGQAIPPNLGGPVASFDFEGFYPPVEPEPTLNKVKAGSAVPLKFSLGEDKGLNVIDAGYPASRPLACATLDPSGDLQPTQTTGKSALSYDAQSDQYTYIWKTDKTWARTCRVLALQLVDGTEHLAAFQFK